MPKIFLTFLIGLLFFADDVYAAPADTGPIISILPGDALACPRGAKGAIPPAAKPSKQNFETILKDVSETLTNGIITVVIRESGESITLTAKDGADDQVVAFLGELTNRLRYVLEAQITSPEEKKRILRGFIADVKDILKTGHFDPKMHRTFALVYAEELLAAIVDLGVWKVGQWDLYLRSLLLKGLGRALSFQVYAPALDWAASVAYSPLPLNTCGRWIGNTLVSGRTDSYSEMIRDPALNSHRKRLESQSSSVVQTCKMAAPLAVYYACAYGLEYMDPAGMGLEHSSASVVLVSTMVSAAVSSAIKSPEAATEELKKVPVRVVSLGLASVKFAIKQAPRVWQWFDRQAQEMSDALDASEGERVF